MKEEVCWENNIGYKLIKKMFSISEIDSLILETDLLEQEKDRKDYVWKYYEVDSKKISRIEYFVKYKNFFYEFANSKKIKDLISDLFGE